MNERRECADCGRTFTCDKYARRPGRIDQCPPCGALPGADVAQVGGNMVWAHKTAPELEIKPMDEARAFACTTRRLGAGVTASLTQSKAGAEREMFRHGQWMSDEKLKG